MISERKRAIFLPYIEVFQNDYIGNTLNNHIITEDEQIYDNTIRETVSYSFKTYFHKFLAILFGILLLPFIVIEATITYLFINKGFSNNFTNKYITFLHIVLLSRKEIDKKTITTSKRNDLHKENIPEFIEHLKSCNLTIHFYHITIFKNVDENTDPLKIIKQLAKSNDVFPVRNATDLISIASYLNYSPFHSFYITNKDTFFQELISALPNVQGYDMNVFRTKGKPFINIKNNFDRYLIAKETLFFKNDLVFFVDDNTNPELINYINYNYEKITEQFSSKGFKFLFLPRLKQIVSNDLNLDFLKFNNPNLYSFDNKAIDDTISTLLAIYSSEELTTIILESLYLPYFEKPALLRSVFNAKGITRPNTKFTYASVRESNWESFDVFFEWYFDRLEIPEVSIIMYSLGNINEEETATYEGNIKSQLDKIVAASSDDVMVNSLLYLFNKLNHDRPELVSRIRENVNSKNLLEINLALSEVHISKSLKIYLKDFGNKEVKLYPLARCVYLFYLSKPSGIPFKELYEYKRELLSIYGRISNKSSKEECEAAIDTLIDNTDTSLSQNVSRIRKAFRDIMSENNAINYYIDGPKGGAKKIPIAEDVKLIKYL